jgi:AAA domain
MSASVPARIAAGYRHVQTVSPSPELADLVTELLGGAEPADFLTADDDKLSVIRHALLAMTDARSVALGVMPADVDAVEVELHRLRVRDKARRILEAEQGDASGHLDRLERHLVSDGSVEDLDDPTWIIDRVVPEGALVVPYGPPKHGKSFVTIDQAMSVATGTPWAPSEHHNWGGGFTVQRGPVLYVVAEGVGGLKRRRRAWLEHHGLDDGGDMHWITAPVNLTDAGQVDAFLKVAELVEPVMVVFDTLARCSGGIDENSPRDMGQVIEGIDRIREETGAAVLTPHHTGKDLSKGLRGHSALHGALDASFQITRDGSSITWRCTDMKDAPEPSAMTFDMLEVAGSVALRVGAAPAGKADGADMRTVALAAVEAVKVLTAELGRPPSQRSVVEQMAAVQARQTTKRAALDYAVEARLLVVESGPRRSLLYALPPDPSECLLT